jgi:hypothetical protein
MNTTHADGNFANQTALELRRVGFIFIGTNTAVRTVEIGRQTAVATEEGVVITTNSNGREFVNRPKNVLDMVDYINAF